MKKLFSTINRKIFAILLLMGLAGVATILPYMIEMLSSGLFDNKAQSEIPLPLIILLSFVQNGVLLSILILIGMKLSERVGLQMPLINAWANRENPANTKSIILSGFLIGAAAGIILVAIEAAFFLKHLPEQMLTLFDIPLWKRLLGGVVYGGFTEELIMRLFLLSLIVWLLGKWLKTPEGLPNAKAFWIAIIFVAVIFGLGHLPVTSVMTPLTPTIVIRALVLNGIAGVAFGYLYWKNGLEAAIIGHASTHLIMQIPGVMFLNTLL